MAKKRRRSDVAGGHDEGDDVDGRGGTTGSHATTVHARCPGGLLLPFGFSAGAARACAGKEKFSNIGEGDDGQTDCPTTVRPSYDGPGILGEL